MFIFGIIWYFFIGMLFDIFALKTRNKIPFFKEMFTYEEANYVNDGEEWTPQKGLLLLTFIWPFVAVGGAFVYTYRSLLKGFGKLFEFLTKEKCIPEKPDADLLKAEKEVEAFLLKS
jgi:hypothetical protein